MSPTSHMVDNYSLVLVHLMPLSLDHVTLIAVVVHYSEVFTPPDACEEAYYLAGR
jgi:hypothetical protein